MEKQRFVIRVMLEQGEVMWVGARKELVPDANKAYHFSGFNWRKIYNRFRPEEIIITKVNQ